MIDRKIRKKMTLPNIEVKKYPTNSNPYRPNLTGVVKETNGPTAYFSSKA